MMSDKPLISVIIPVYNGEKYLRECIDSLLCQTFKELEILLINDGSTDSSGRICDEYAARDSRIRVIHKENTGISDTRNIGKKAARANVIGFVDADDWVDERMFERMYSVMQQNGSDVVVCNYYSVYRNRKHLRRFKVPEGNYTKEEILTFILSGTIQTFLWNKLFRRKITDEHMPEGRLYEDNAIIHKWFNNLEKVTVIHDGLYFYRQRKSSVMHNRDNAALSYDYLLSEKEKHDFAKQYGYIHQTALPHVFRSLRAAKFIARGHSSKAEKLYYLSLVREYMQQFSQISNRQLGVKTALRRWLLMHHPRIFLPCQYAIGRLSMCLKFRQDRLFD